MRFLLFALAVPLLAQSPGAPARLQGTVVNSVTGAPVKHAGIQASSTTSGAAGGAAVTANEEGQFEIRDLKPGTYRLTARHPSFPQPMSGFPKRTDSITVSPGEVRSGLTVRLVPPGVITGKVVDMDGDPLRGCQVMLLAPSFQRGRTVFMQMNAAGTNDKGEYRLYHLAPGEYRLSAACFRPVLQAIPLRSTVEKPDGGIAYGQQYYPGASDITGAGPVPVTPGAEVQGIDFRLPVVSVFPVSGTLKAPSEAASLPVEVSLVPSEAAERVMGPSHTTAVPPAAGGKWKVPAVPPGTYDLLAFIRGPLAQFSGSTTVTVRDSALQGVSIELAPAAHISGTVRLEGDSTLPEHTYLSLVGSTVGPMSSGGYAQVKDGRFTMANVMPGQYEVLLQSGTPAYIKSVTAGGQSTPPFKVNISTTGVVLDVVLSTKLAKIDGAVEGDGSMIVVLPSGEAAGSVARQRVSIADSSGRFSFAGLPPGEYKLAALAGAEVNVLENPAVRELIEANGETVRLGEGETVSKQLRTITLPK